MQEHAFVVAGVEKAIPASTHRMTSCHAREFLGVNVCQLEAGTTHLILVFTSLINW